MIYRGKILFNPFIFYGDLLYRLLIHYCACCTQYASVWNDGITGRALDMITQVNGWYLQFEAGVDELEKSGILNLLISDKKPGSGWLDSIKINLLCFASQTYLSNT